jgi:protein-disulfide isomerase
MQRARAGRASADGVRFRLALSCLLGSVGCGGGFASAQPPSQAHANSTQIELAPSGGPSWPTLAGPADEAEPVLTDADVEQIATRVSRAHVPTVSAQNPSKGFAKAKVTLQIFSDFECPFCVRVAPALDEVAERFHDRVRVVWRNYPLPSHQRARPAARAALAAFASGGSGSFWKLHDWLYSADADLSDEGLRRAAEKLGLDAASIGQAATSARYDALIDADVAAGDAANIQGTPAVFINDYYLMGARHAAEYARVIERALREAK